MTFTGDRDQDHPHGKRNAKKAKWLSEEALQIAVKRQEAKSKGEKERYSHLNAEFQRIARRDKKAFLSGQCKEIEENNLPSGLLMMHVLSVFFFFTRTMS